MAKQTRGRQKLDMKTIADENKRHVTFSKRRTGLFNKAAELNILTGAETAAIVFSRHGKVYTFQTPGAMSLIENFFLDRNNSPVLALPADSSHRELQCLKEALSHHEEEKERYEMSSTTRMMGDSGGGRGSLGLGFWWDRPIESMDMGEVERFKEALVTLRKMVAERAEAMLTVKKATPFMSMSNYGETLGGFGDQEIRVEDYLVDGGGGAGQAVHHGPMHLPSS